MDSLPSAVGPPSRPQHRRNQSSKGILKSIMSYKSVPISRDASSPRAPTSTTQTERTQQVPLLPADHPHARSSVLGERQSNVQSPRASPLKKREQSGPALKSEKASKSIRNDTGGARSPQKSEHTAGKPKKSKSSTSLSAMFSRINRSSKDLSTYAAAPPKDKENTTPPSSSNSQAETPIWAQFASADKAAERPTTSTSQSSQIIGRSNATSQDVQNEIDLYTPKDYSPLKQRNFNGGFDQPALRPTLGSRPQSAFVTGSESFLDALGRRVSGDRTQIGSRGSEGTSRRQSKDHQRRVSGERAVLTKRQSEDRKISGSSAEYIAPKQKLTIAKRGARVMAAVAALSGKAQDGPSSLDPKAVDTAFEAVLESRNIPEPMRQKMRSLTLRVKADFIKQDQSSAKTSSHSPAGTAEDSKSPVDAQLDSKDRRSSVDEDSIATKRSRPRSRTFTFSKGDRSDPSPSKKACPQSKNRPTSIHIPKSQSTKTLGTPSTPTKSSQRKGAATTVPSDFITYLSQVQDPVKVEVGRLHKLRLLLRNETVAWVDSFISLGGMAEIVGLLHRIMGVEWREEHEDQLLHESLLCLKGLCTTERALSELEKVADKLFPALLGMLFDDEKKGPAEYTTRTIIINVLFTFLASCAGCSSAILEQRARRILNYLGEPEKAEDARPVDFVLGMRVPRPYKLWCREVSNVTKEVFWIFLHHLNVVSSPKSEDASPADSVVEASTEERAEILAATYTQRHFPGSRPPVPAAPYIGGVEWDATTYLTAHLDLMNGLIACIPTADARNNLRAELQASGFEKTLGSSLRTCKEKFYSGVHDGLRAWVAAAAEDGWDTTYVRNGPTQEERSERARSTSPKKSPKKKEVPPQLEAPKMELPQLDLGIGSSMKNDTSNDDDGWLG